MLKVGRLHYTSRGFFFDLLVTLKYVTKYLYGIKLWNNWLSSSFPLLHLFNIVHKFQATHLGQINLFSPFPYKVEWHVTNHLRDFALYMEKYNVVQISPRRKIEVIRTSIFWVFLFLKLQKVTNIWSQKFISSMSTTCHNRSFLLTLLALEHKDMCHCTIDFGLIEIQSQSHWNHDTL